MGKNQGKWYYLDAAKGGAATVGWKRIGNFKYYFNEYCAMEQDLDNILGRQSSYQITVNLVKMPGYGICEERDRKI